MRTIKAFLVLSLLLFSSPATYALNKILHYKPEKVVLQGTIEIQTFPGAPNYASIKDGDKIERAWILRLDDPFDMVPTSRDEDVEATAEKNIKFVHLAIMNDDLWPKIKTGKHVSVEGVIYHRENGHHHSRVLLETEKLW